MCPWRPSAKPNVLLVAPGGREQVVIEFGGLDLTGGLPDIPRWASLYPGERQHTEYYGRRWAGVLP